VPTRGLATAPFANSRTATITARKEQAVNYWTIGLVLAIPVGFRIWRSLQPLKVSSSDTSRFVGVGRTCKIYTVTGRAHDVTKGSTHTVTEYTDGTKKTSASTIHDQFFVTDRDGMDHPLNLTDFNVAIAGGHIVSAAWAIRAGKKTGAYFMVVNHTTGQRYFHNEAIARITIGQRFWLNVQALTVIFLPVFAAFIIFAATYRIQIYRFKRQGVDPLVKALDAGADAFPRLGDMRVDELDRLAVLAREGLLTDTEWTRAKELFIGKAPDAKASALDHLAEVHKLYREGVLTESEFNLKKWDILSSESHAG
jgi:hypothetical protein